MRSKQQLWAVGAPLVLASKSTSRRALLTAAGFDVEVLPADVDERAVEADYVANDRPAEGLAGALAEAKALAVSVLSPEAYVLGADQTLACEGRLLHKAADLVEAAETLAMLEGRTHILTSAYCVARGGRILGGGADRALLKMRPLAADQISGYLAFAGPDIISSLGAYQIEGIGIHLFERVDGDHSTVLGLPMLKLLAWFRREGLLVLR